jgi:glycosyltransferase involved in cell wall biosynthesis
MNPRVIVLTTYYRPVLGGVESNAERLARFLVGDGFRVRVVTKRVAPGLPDAEVVDGVSVSRIGPIGERSGSGKWRLLPHAFAWLVRHAAEFDVVCVVDYRGIGLAALAARAVRGRPVVFQAQTTGVLTVSGLDPLLARVGAGPQGAPAKAVKWPLRALYTRADALACISRILEREAIAAGFPPDRVHFLPNAIDMTRFRPADGPERERLRAALGWPVGQPICVFVGRLSREKGVMELVQAWRMLQPSDARLVVAGPDMPGNAWDVGPAARAFVAQHGMQETVSFTGPASDVPGLLRPADVAVVPSHFEAQGLSAVEALACGLPVVASAVGGLIDFVVDGRNGRLCPPKDPAALANALQPLLMDPALRAGLAARARASVIDEYDEQKVFGRFAALIRRVCEDRARP